MTVEKLIKQLQEFNPKATVKMHHRDAEPVLFVMGIVGDEERVWLESESDNDMGSEIGARFDAASEYWESELDFYMDLLETGIDVDMVRKYMDDEIADHMKEFCEEHGLL